MKFDVWGLFKILNHLWETFFSIYWMKHLSCFFFNFLASKQRCAALRNFTWLFSTTEEEINTSLLILEGWWEGGGCSFKPLSSSIFGGRSAALTPTVELWDLTGRVPTQCPPPSPIWCDLHEQICDAAKRRLSSGLSAAACLPAAKTQLPARAYWAEATVQNWETRSGCSHSK